MPKRKRKDHADRTDRGARSTTAAPTHVAGTTGPDPAIVPPPVPAAAKPAVDPAVALFAQRHQEGIEREKVAQRARADERRKAGERDRLEAVKEAAVAEMKRATRSTSATPDERTAAEAAYRAATADLIAFDTGERPTWAPAVALPGDPDGSHAEAAAEGSDEGDDEAGGDGEAVGDGEASGDEPEVAEA